VFDYPPRKDTFVIELRDPDRIAEARRILAGNATDGTHVGGIIIKQPAPYNVPWSYHLDPSTICFFEVATEVCDAAISYVEEHLDEVGGAFLPEGRWCPWGSRLLKELVGDKASEAVVRHPGA
jgi:hypothetical protein